MPKQHSDAASDVIAALKQLKHARVRELGGQGKAFAVHWSGTIWHGNRPTKEEYEFLQALNNSWPISALLLDPAIDDDIEREVFELPNVEKRGDALILPKDAFTTVVKELYRGNWAMLFFPVRLVPGDIPWIELLAGANVMQALLQKSGAAAGIVSGPDDLDWQLFFRSEA